LKLTLGAILNICHFIARELLLEVALRSAKSAAKFGFDLNISLIAAFTSFRNWEGLAISLPRTAFNSSQGSQLVKMGNPSASSTSDRL
jgi:hypothetical protein